jgi:hypothetical protein
VALNTFRALKHPNYISLNIHILPPLPEIRMLSLKIVAHGPQYPLLPPQERSEPVRVLLCDQPRVGEAQDGGRDRYLPCREEHQDQPPPARRKLGKGRVVSVPLVPWVPFH